jgi:hypothetical protein
VHATPLFSSKKTQNTAIKRGKQYASQFVQYADCFWKDYSGKFLPVGKETAERLQCCDRYQNRGRSSNLDLPFLV